MKNKYSESDYWTKKAFSEGYPARSVYKLEAINDKFNLLNSNSKVLDLGAAPGSWTSFLLRNLGAKARVVSVDLKPLDSKIMDERLVFIQGDMTEKCVFVQVERYSPFDLVVCDVAPHTSGHKDIDIVKQNSLAISAYFYATKVLVAGGCFVTKIFQGRDMRDIIEFLKNGFSTVKTFKPETCRKNSVETYIIGINLKEALINS